MTSLTSFQCPNCTNNLSRGPSLFTVVEGRQVSGTDWYCVGCKHEYIQEVGNAKLTPFKSPDGAQVGSGSSDPSHTIINTKRQEAGRAPEEAQAEVEEPVDVSEVAVALALRINGGAFQAVTLVGHQANESGRYINFVYRDGIKCRIHLYKTVQ